MSKSRKMIKGAEYIRIAPTKCEDYSYTNKTLVFDGYTRDGLLIVHYPAGSFRAKCSNRGSFILPKDFADKNWRFADVVYRGVKTSLNLLKGKKVIAVTAYFPGLNYRCDVFDGSFMVHSHTLISATREHVVLKDDNGDTCILDNRFTNPDFWVEA